MPDWTLWYWIRGSGRRVWNMVKVSPGTLIGELTKRIRRDQFDSLPTSIDVYKVPENHPVCNDDIIGSLSISALGNPLLLPRTVSSYFASPPQHQLHLIIDVPTLFIQCWIRGADSQRFVTVETSKFNDLAQLRRAIKDEGLPPTDIPAYCLRLYKISTKDHELAESLAKGGAGQLLDGAQSLEIYFDDIPLSAKPRVVVEWLDSNLKLACLVLGDDVRTGIFMVQIARTAKVSDLKQAIKNQNPELVRMSDRAIVLHAVSVHKDDRDEIPNGVSLDCELDALDLLSVVFTDPPLEDHLHIIITSKGRPLPGASRDRFLPSDFRSVAAKRTQYLNANEPKPPSSAGKASAFAKSQNDPEKTILCSRPPTAESIIPVTLLHPVFGEFLDNCQAHETTAEDNRFAMELSIAMSDFYTDEERRANAIRNVFAKHNLHFIRTKVGTSKYETDGDLSVDDYRYVIAEFKNEVGSTGAEPYSQAGLYYLESTRTQAPKLPESVLPCFIVLIFGPYLVFAGAAWTDRPTLQLLSTPLALYYHRTDTENQTRAAKHVGALKKMVLSLKDHYLALKASSSSSLRAQLYPYRTYFKPLTDNDLQAFEYTSQPFANKLLFFGKLANNDGICVKFSRRYSREAHSLCASMGWAPTLRGFEQIAGGWSMIVMDALPEHYTPLSKSTSSRPASLQKKIEDRLTQLHQEGYVHGDVRDMNIMVSSADREGFMLVDFDWAGKVGEVRYPMNVNRDDSQGLWRPDGAVDGQLILVDHDIAMLEKIFDPSSFL